MRNQALTTIALLALGACATPPATPRAVAPADDFGSTPVGDVWAEPATWSAAGDPTQFEIPLEAADGWHAALVLDNGTTGIWTLRAMPVFDAYATPEIVGLDDLGRCHVMVSYSGKWTPVTTIADKKWLGGLDQADVDPRIPGMEIYTGGARGNLYQVRAYRDGLLDNRLIAQLPGKEIHTIVAGEVDGSSHGPEVLVLTRPGELYRVTPTGPDGTFETTHVGPLPGRVRDAVVLPGHSGAPEIACVSRAGWLRIVRMLPGGPEWTSVYEAPMGKGRLALRRGAPGDPVGLYTTHDDGRILRHTRIARDRWETETIYLGPQGPRGIVSGVFDDDPATETVAIFGYSGRVEILTERDGIWSAETIFTDRHKGHWLTIAEVDGRNATDELVASGYGARIVLFSRPPGYGLGGVPAAGR